MQEMYIITLLKSYDCTISYVDTQGIKKPLFVYLCLYIKDRCAYIQKRDEKYGRMHPK